MIESTIFEKVFIGVLVRWNMFRMDLIPPAHLVSKVDTTICNKVNRECVQIRTQVDEVRKIRNSIK